MKTFNYKFVASDFTDLHTRTTEYVVGKTIKIAKSKRNKHLCSAGVLHASRSLSDLVLFWVSGVRPEYINWSDRLVKTLTLVKLRQLLSYMDYRHICVVYGKEVVSGEYKSGFHEYLVVKIFKSKFDLIAHYFCPWLIYFSGGRAR
jgi:hypothetical protein